MIKVTTIGGAVAALLLMSSCLAQAQNEGARVFVDTNVGAQATSRTSTSSSTFPLYGETATIGSSATVGSGLMGDVGGGVKIGRLGVGVTVSVFNHDAEVTTVAALPSPVAYASFTNVSTSATGLQHTEVGTHVKLLYFQSVGDKVELALSGGPSFVRVTHSVPAASVAGGTQTLTVTGTEEHGSSVGYNVGGDLNYLLSAQLGVGGFVRYTGATVDLPSTNGLKVGGLQVGGGIRVRF